MNKGELINAVAVATEIKKKDVEAVINASVDAVLDALKNGDKVQILGFGSFEVKKVAARTGRNPQTGAAIKIPASKKPAFSASKAMKDAVNG